MGKSQQEREGWPRKEELYHQRALLPTDKGKSEINQNYFQNREFVPLLEPKLTHISIEKEEVLRATLEKLTKENEELQSNLYRVTNEKNEFKWKLERKKMQLQVNMEKMDKKEYKRKRVKHGLDQADSCLDTVKGQLKKAGRDFREKDKWWGLAIKEKKERRETLEVEIEDLSISLHDSKARAHWEYHYKESDLVAAHITQGKCQEEENAHKWVQHWKGRFDSL